MKIKWNLKLFYISMQDPFIERDYRIAAAAVKKFRKKYLPKVSLLLNSKTKLKAALSDYEKVWEYLASAKPLMYFYYLNAVNSSNLKIQAKLNDYLNKYTELQNSLLFFTNLLKRFDFKEQPKLLRDLNFLKYNYFLKINFKEGRYILEDSAEEVLNLKYLPSHFLWVQMNERNLNKETIKLGNKAMPFNEAVNVEKNLPLKRRRRLHQILNDKFLSLAEISETELNAVLLNKKIDDRLRGFAKPYDSRLLSDQMEEKTVLSLEKAVADKYKISHNFYSLKRKILQLSKLRYEDRAVPILKHKKILKFSQAVDVLSDFYKTLDENYLKIFKGFLRNGQIDVYPRSGKRGGAFCSWTFSNPTFILLNQVDDYNSLFTFAHEMGHALHAEFSRNQIVFYQDPVISTAETASTLFENLLYDYLLERTDNKAEKIEILHNRLNSSIATVFRQMSFFEFEKDLHNIFRSKGFLAKEEIAELFLKHLQSYLGSAFQLSVKDGYSFVYISHFRNFFYVYNYVFGHLISRLMAERLKQDKKFINKINKFLLAGGSDSPKNIFKSIGIDINSPVLWQESLSYIEKDLKLLKKLFNE